MGGHLHASNQPPKNPHLRSHLPLPPFLQRPRQRPDEARVLQSKFSPAHQKHRERTTGRPKISAVLAQKERPYDLLTTSSPHGITTASYTWTARCPVFTEPAASPGLPIALKDVTLGQWASVVGRLRALVICKRLALKRNCTRSTKKHQTNCWRKTRIAQAPDQRKRETEYFKA